VTKAKPKMKAKTNVGVIHETSKVVKTRRASVTSGKPTRYSKRCH
jgi:hypothetical protein